MGYHVVTITLHNKRVFRQAVVDSGRITRVRGYSEIPFHEEEIADIEIIQRWDWRMEN